MPNPIFLRAVSFYALMSFINHEWTSPAWALSLSGRTPLWLAASIFVVVVVVVKAAAMHISFCVFHSWWDDERKRYTFLPPRYRISGYPSLWHVKHLHNSANMTFSLYWMAALSLCQGTWWKITTTTYSWCGVFKIDKETQLAFLKKDSHAPGS